MKPEKKFWYFLVLPDGVFARKKTAPLWKVNINRDAWLPVDEHKESKVSSQELETLFQNFILQVDTCPA
jgi:hypothetical protein